MHRQCRDKAQEAVGIEHIADGRLLDVPQRAVRQYVHPNERRLVFDLPIQRNPAHGLHIGHQAAGRHEAHQWRSLREDVGEVRPDGDTG